MRNWSDLVVWQESHDLVLLIYKMLRSFPKEEAYGLVSQIKRACVSIPTNIVEGHAKNSSKEFIRFLYISRGSLEEVKYLLLVSRDLEFLSKDEYSILEEKLNRIGYLLNNFINAIKKHSTTSNTSTTPKTSKTSKTHTNSHKKELP